MTSDLAADVITATGPGDHADLRPSDPVQLLVRRVLPVALVLAVIAVMVRAAALPLGNSDTYFHLRFGSEFLEGRWSLSDPGSVTAWGTADWVPTQWLPQVAMAWLDEQVGLAGVAWFAGLQFVVLVVVLFLVASRNAVPLVAAAVTVVALVACLSGLSARPQVMSYALAAMTTAAWLSAARTGRVPWLLLPLTWFWACYHGMWPVGIVIGLVACLGQAIDRTTHRRTLGVMVLIPLGSLVAAGLTPVGPALYGAVLTVNSRSSYFAEWGPADFTGYNGIALVLLMGTALLLITRSRPSWTMLLLTGLAGGWALYSLRTVPVAAAMLVPLVALASQGAVLQRDRLPRSDRVLVLLGAATGLLALAAVVPSTADRPDIDLSSIVSELSDLPDGAPVLTDTDTGGHLMWADPRLDVLMSGYGDIYSDSELEAVSVVNDARAGWDDVVREMGARTAVTVAKSPLGYALQLVGWQERAREGDIIVLEAPDDW